MESFCDGKKWPYFINGNLNDDFDVDSHNCMALRLAVSTNNLEIVKLLVENGTDIHLNKDLRISLAKIKYSNTITL